MTVNRGNAFSAVSLSEYMATSLPKEPTPQLRNASDAIALLSHACMRAAGFRLVGLGEERKIGMDIQHIVLVSFVLRCLLSNTRLSRNSAKLSILHSFSAHVFQNLLLIPPHRKLYLPNGMPPKASIMRSNTPITNHPSNTYSKSPASAASPSSTVWPSKTTKCTRST
jgi:hypothetical protein